jgi:membrane-associated phospholipid phosphatase
MRRNRSSQCFFVLLVVLATEFVAQAQTRAAPSPTPTVSPTPSLEREFFKNILRDQKAIWTSPLHLGRKDVKWMIPAGIGMGALITTDRITGDEIAESGRGTTASRIISYPGSTSGVTAVAAMFYIVGRRTNNARARETGILSAQAALDSLIVGGALKAASQRARPEAVRERSEFFDGGTSFPSGHSIQAWSVAAIIANEYHDNRKVQIAAYSIASAVSVARFTVGKHYISDVLAGSALGYMIGRYVYHAHHRETMKSSGENEDEVSKWPTITPRYNRGARQYGIGLKWSF